MRTRVTCPQVVGSTLLNNRATPEEQAAAATDTGWEDSFVRFHPDCREMIAGSPSRHGVDRNAEFLADVVRPMPTLDIMHFGPFVTRL